MTEDTIQKTHIRIFAESAAQAQAEGEPFKHALFTAIHATLVDGHRLSDFAWFRLCPRVHRKNAPA